MEKFLKIVKVLANTLTTIIIIVGLVFVLLYAIGIEPFVVLSGSMEDDIKTGSLSFINKHAKYEELKEGDIIGYVSVTDRKVLHRIVLIDEEGIHTKGDANEEMDGTVVTQQNYIGKAVFWVPELGYTVKAIQTKRGKIILTTVIVAMALSAFLLGESSDDKKKKCGCCNNETKCKGKNKENDCNDRVVGNSENSNNQSISNTEVGKNKNSLDIKDSEDKDVSNTKDGNEGDKYNE